eukprot:6184243-Pleurochrysis_carterae.AAC.1
MHDGRRLEANQRMYVGKVPYGSVFERDPGYVTARVLIIQDNVTTVKEYLATKATTGIARPRGDRAARLRACAAATVSSSVG